MLKLLANYLFERKQRVVLGDVNSKEHEVTSGVPQGSILGPLLFVLFINDLHECVSSGTNIALYADDTKIWCTINSEEDCIILQNDINSLYEWSVINKMNFHPQKCKVLTVSHRHESFYILPFDRFLYSMNNEILDYCTKEKDLGIIVQNRLSWAAHSTSILSIATSRFNILRRTCHFIKNASKRRTLYLTMVRSLFEHGSVVWSPSAKTTLENFEAFQKRCIKWILNEQFVSYSKADYISKLISLDILPLSYKFSLADLVTFHKIVHNLIPVTLPHYISIRSNTRSCDMLT